MSYHVFFSMSTGLSKPITVPKGTLDRILERVHLTEEALGFETEQFKNNPKYWRNTRETKPGVSDETFCEVAEQHNRFVRELYIEFEKCSEKLTPDGEVITPEQSVEFWYGLTTINVPAHRWTGDYYRARMEALYFAMRGAGDNQRLLTEGVVFDSKALTVRQAADVIGLFSEFLDPDDLRLDVPLGMDSLESLSDGGYYWCEKCGAVTEQHAASCRKRKCPIKAEWGDQAAKK